MIIYCTAEAVGGVNAHKSVNRPEEKKTHMGNRIKVTIQVVGPRVYLLFGRLQMEVFSSNIVIRDRKKNACVVVGVCLQLGFFLHYYEAELRLVACSLKL